MGWSLRQLPHSSLQNLKALQLTWLNLQLQPGPGQWHYARLNGPGVLGALGALPKLTRLDLHNCKLLCYAPGCAGLAAALAQTGLQHLSISRVTSAHEASGPPGFVVPDSALQPLQQLTHLTLVGCRVPKHPGAAWPTSAAWPPGPTGTGLCCLQGLTGLKELKLRLKGNTWTGGQLHGWHDAIQAIILSELQQLTRLHLGGKFEPGCLAGLTQLRHLTFDAVCHIVPDALPGALGASDVRPGPTVRRLLSHLQGMQHLTSLTMGHSLSRPGVAPAAAYAALTASTNLQQLDIRHSTLPEGAWEHMSPAGRQMPQLRELHITAPGVRGPSTCRSVAAPEGSRLVSRCPGLEVLRMEGVQYDTNCCFEGIRS